MVVGVGEIIIGNPLSHYPQIVERTSLLNVAFYVLSQSTVRNHVFATQLRCVFKVSVLNVSWWYFQIIP